jgi:hypothetical protein
VAAPTDEAGVVTESKVYEADSSYSHVPPVRLVEMVTVEVPVVTVVNATPAASIPVVVALYGTVSVTDVAPLMLA